MEELIVEFADGGMTDTYFMKGDGLYKGLYDEVEPVAIARDNKAIVNAIIQDSCNEVKLIKVDNNVIYVKE